MSAGFPLAIYTADRGLAWTYPEDQISYAVLDKCRTLLGPLPDFEAGESGFEGVAVAGDFVFAIRCFSVPRWDFCGRDATYLAVTWVVRKRAVSIDFEQLLQAEALNVPTHTPPREFSCPIAWSPFPSEPFTEEGVLFRRELG